MSGDELEALREENARLREKVQRLRKQAGDEEVLVVPLPVCATCHPWLSAPGGLRKAVRAIPGYATLLDRDRAAELSLVV